MSGKELLKITTIGVLVFIISARGISLSMGLTQKIFVAPGKLTLDHAVL
jgi:hypothetical protein